MLRPRHRYGSWRSGWTHVVFAEETKAAAQTCRVAESRVKTERPMSWEWTLVSSQPDTNITENVRDPIWPSLQPLTEPFSEADRGAPQTAQRKPAKYHYLLTSPLTLRMSTSPAWPSKVTSQSCQKVRRSLFPTCLWRLEVRFHWRRLVGVPNHSASYLEQLQAEPPIYQYAHFVRFTCETPRQV